jgi:hypothetical protein
MIHSTAQEITLTSGSNLAADDGFRGISHPRLSFCFYSPTAFQASLTALASAAPDRHTMKKQERFEILLEDIQSKFDLVLEGHGALHEKIDRTGQQLGERIDTEAHQTPLKNFSR